MFNIGDMVSKRDGTPFSNGAMIVTVRTPRVDYGKDAIWLLETDTWLDRDKLVLAIPATPPTEADIKELI